MKQTTASISTDKSSRNEQSAGSSRHRRNKFFTPSVQPKLSVNQPNDASEQEADQVAQQVMSKPANGTAPGSFFTPSPTSVQTVPASIQREENDKAKKPDDTGSKVLTEGAGVVWEQLKLQPGFEAWKEEQTKRLKYTLWENQPSDFKFGIASFGLATAGLLGTTLALDPGFRNQTLTALDSVPLPLYLIPGSEYLGVSSFKYKLPSAEAAPYTFSSEFDLDFYMKLAREKLNIPKVGLTVGVDSAFSQQQGFTPLTGGNIKLKLGGGVVNIQGFYNQTLPPTPMLISDPTKGDPPTWLMRSLPGQLEENLPVGTGVYITVDILRLPEVFGGGKKETPKREQKDTVSRKENANSNDVSGQPAPPIVGDVLSSGRGEQLDTSTRNFMESRFDQDFSHVRVHTDGQASESAKAIDAKAYTSGSDIVFDKGQYQPSNESGKSLLAHELVHVIQQSGNVHRKATPSAEAVPVDVDLEAQAIKRIKEKLELNDYADANEDLNNHIGKGNMKRKKEWLAQHKDIHQMFLKRLPAAVIAEIYSPEELMVRSSVTAFATIDCWYHSEEEKQLLYIQNLRLFDHIMRYISPYTGEPMRDVIADLTKTIDSKKYTSSFDNKEFHIVHLLAPTVERKFRFYKQYSDLFKLVSKKFDPFTGIRHETMKYLTDTNEVNREQALFIYNQLRILPEEQRRAFIETGLFSSTLETDKDAEAYFKKNYGAQYKELPHNWDAALWPWTWGNWDAPFAERLTIDHVALMSSALNYEDKSTRKFGFDRGLDTTVNRPKGKTVSDASRLILQLQDDANFTNPERLVLLLAIGVRAQMENEITTKVLVPKNKEGKISKEILPVVENAGFVAAKDFKYQADRAQKVDHDKSIIWYGVKQTLFGGKEGSVFGEQRGTFDLRTLQQTEMMKGSIGGLKFGAGELKGDEYYNNEWLDKQIKENQGSESLQPNIDEYKGSARQGKIFASIRPGAKQANIYASSLPIEGLNYFGAGTLYRSGPGLLQGVAVNLSWTKEPANPDNAISLGVSLENIQMSNFQMVAPKSTLAIGHISLTGLRLALTNDQMAAKGYTFMGLFKSADLTVKTLLNLLPNVLKLIPYTVLTMTEEFKGVKVNVYKDALGALMQSTFGTMQSSLTFTSVRVKNLYDTAAGFLDDFSIEDKDESGRLVRQGLNVRETTLWTIDASQNIKRRLRTIDNKIRSMMARLAKSNEDVQLEALEKERQQLLNITAEKGLKYENRDAEMSRLREIMPLMRKLNEDLNKKFEQAKIDNPLYNPESFLVLEKEKADLEKDLRYLDNQYYDDKKKAEGDDGGVDRYEARKRKGEFEARYRSFDVDFSLKGITLKGGDYVKDLINDSLKSMGFESPKLEGIENINIGSIQSAFISSGKGASAQGNKPGIAIRRLHIPVIKSPALNFKAESMRLEADSPLLENVFASVTIDFAANPLDKNPASLYKYKLTNLWIGHATFNGLRLFTGRDVPLLDFPTGIAVEAWGLQIWDYDPSMGNINLRIRDIKAAGKYQEKNETDKTRKEVTFGLDTTLDNDTDAGRKHAIELKYNKQEQTVETKLNIASAWIDALNIQSPDLSINSLPDVKAIAVKNIQANVKVWLKKENDNVDVNRDLTLDINSLKIGEIAAQGIKVTKSEETAVDTRDPKKKKTVRKIQEVRLPKENQVSIRDIDVSGLRVTLANTGTLLETTGTEDASVKLGKTDMSGIGYEQTSKGSVLKTLTLHTARFNKLDLQALGRNGRQYTLAEFFKFFGRTRLEGLEASASFTEGTTSGSIGVKGQTKNTKEGVQNVPISVDYHEAVDDRPGYYSMRLPLSRINVPALNIQTGEHVIKIPRPADKARTSHLSDVDIRLRAIVNIPADGKVSYDIYLDSLDIADFVVFGLEYHNSLKGIDVVFDKTTGLHIPNVKAGGFRFSSAKGFDVFGKAGGWIKAAQDGTESIEASFESIKSRLTNGEFLAESMAGRSALAIDIASLGFEMDKAGNMTLTLGAIQGGFPKLKITQTDPVTKAKTQTEITSVAKAINVEKVSIKLNADSSKEIDATNLVAGGLKIVSTENTGTKVNETSVTLGADALGADSAHVKLNADKTKEITLKGIRGGKISTNLITYGPGGKGTTSVKYITLPDPDVIKVDAVKIEIDDKDNKSITLEKPVVRNFLLRMPDQSNYGDFTMVMCDLEVNGNVKLGDGDFDTLAVGAPYNAFVVNIPDNVPVEVKNFRLTYKDTSKTPPSPATPPKGLTKDQEKLLQLEKERDDAAETLANTPPVFFGPNDTMYDNPDYERVSQAFTDAKKAYDAQRSKIIGSAKAEAGASMTKKYLDAVQGSAKITLVAFNTSLELNVETYKGEKYIQITDEVVNRLKSLITSILGTTVNASFWKSDEMKKLGRALQRWYTWLAPATRGLIDAIAKGHAFGAVMVFLEKTNISKGLLKEDPSMFGLNFNINTSWGLDISGKDKFGVGLCEEKYKHPDKSDFYNLWGFIEYLGYVSPALVSRSGQLDAQRMQRLKDKASLTEKQLEDLGIGDAVFELVAFIKYNLGLEADNLQMATRSGIKGVGVVADVTLSPQDVITTLLKEKKAGQLIFDKGKKTIDDVHIDGVHVKGNDPDVIASVGTGPKGEGNILIPGATYTSEDGGTKVTYDSLEITPVSISYHNDIYRVLNKNIQMKGLKAGFKKK